MTKQNTYSKLKLTADLRMADLQTNILGGRNGPSGGPGIGPGGGPLGPGGKRGLGPNPGP